MDYPCDKFGDCSFSRFGSIALNKFCICDPVTLTFDLWPMHVSKQLMLANSLESHAHNKIGADRTSIFRLIA